MSGPTWLPPKQPEPARAPQGRVLPRGAPGPPPAPGAALQPHPRVNFCPLPSEQCYQAPGGPEDRGLAWVGCHGAPQRSQGLPPDRGGLRPGSLDAEIDSLTSMLAELDGGRGHAPRRPDRQAYEAPQPPAYRTGSLKPNGGGVPSPPLPASPYGGPTPASYTTASTPAGPAFPVQVKVAQPVRGCGPPRRGASQASGPLPGPNFPLPGRGEVWGPGYRSHREPGPGGKEEVAGVSGHAGGGRGGGYGPQVPLSQPPEEELERLTKKLVHDMNHPPSGEYFGRCGGCGEDVVGDGAGVVALDRVFHVGCFVCSTCRAQLRGQHFYAVERRAYCESCYVATLEKCSTCSQPILDRILRAMGKAYHPGCFTCVVCHRGLDGIPFTVDATSQIHCIEDFHRSGWVPHLCLRMSGFSHLPHRSFMSQYQPLPFPTPGYASFLLTSISSPRSKTIPLASPVPFFMPPSLGSTVSPLQPSLTASWFPSIPGSLPHDAQCVVGPSCLNQVRRRQCELLLWIAVFTLAVTSARSVGCCCPLRASVRAATHWMGISCARPAVPGASRSSQPLSPPTAESSQKHPPCSPFPRPPSLTSAFTALSPNAISSPSNHEIIIAQEFTKHFQVCCLI
uniref:Thyroid hormone receptor interactor 6 n=1 Tax=Equus caballus TaxID=9796 RepID=A0A9L0SGS8_HORSE